MMLPGLHLRTFAARVCSARTMERVIDPVIADLQSEYAEAQRQHSVWRARLALLRGYVGFWTVLVVAGLLGTVSIVWHEAQVLSTMGLIFAVVTVIATLLFAEPGHYVERFPNAQANHMALRLYLIPSQLPLTVPLSLGCALLGGLTAARLRTRTLVLLVILSAALAIAMFENLERLAPNANQAFREELMGHPVARGSGEMAMDQLRERIASAGVAGLSASAVRDLKLRFHLHWAYSAAPAFVTALALLLVLVNRSAWFGRMLTATVFSVVYAVVALCATDAGHIGALSPFTAAWTPNVVCMLLTLMLACRATTSSSPMSDP